MRIFKSVKLKEDYRNLLLQIKKGTKLVYLNDNEIDKWIDKGTMHQFTEKEILLCNTDLFEYELMNNNFELIIPNEVTLKYCVFSDGTISNFWGTERFLQGRIFHTESEAKEFSEMEKSKFWINRLADWSDEQCNTEEDISIKIPDIELLTCGVYEVSKYRLVFNSIKSANLFIEQINLPENIIHKQNLIKILKSKRL